MLCSGSLGSVPLEQKFRAAAGAGFAFVSVYGHEYRDAVERGVDLAALCDDLDLRVAEVDGIAISLQRPEFFEEAVATASALRARAITVVETEPYDPADRHQVAAAVAAYGLLCDAAQRAGAVVHIEPFAWSSLARMEDVLAIVRGADRPNGGVLLDLWHHTRGPDAGVLPPELEASDLLGVQLADTAAEPWANVRDECMHHRLLPGDGTALLSRTLRELAERGPLPPVGVEVFGAALSHDEPAQAARRAFSATMAVLGDAVG